MTDLGRCLEGRVALVTGAGRGIGRAAAGQAARAGAKVGCVDRDAAAAEAAAMAVRAAGSEAMAAAADIRDGAEVERAVEAVLATFGRLDVLLACAGIYPARPLLEIDDAHWTTVLDVNLRGTMHSVRACAAAMAKAGGGRIVVVSSITGNRAGYPGLVAYSAAKAGINGLIRSAAVELAPLNITVNGVEPGTVRTEGFIESGGDPGGRIAAAVPLQRLAESADIAAPMIFLASDAAAYVTGQTLVVDGGQTLPEVPLTRAG